MVPNLLPPEVLWGHTPLGPTRQHKGLLRCTPRAGENMRGQAGYLWPGQGSVQASREGLGAWESRIRCPGGWGGPMSGSTHKAPAVSAAATALQKALLGRWHGAQSQRGTASPLGPSVGSGQLCRVGAQAAQNPGLADPQPGEAQMPGGEVGKCISQQYYLCPWLVGTCPLPTQLPPLSSQGKN